MLSTSLSSTIVFVVAIPMVSAIEANCGDTTSSWWPSFLTNVDTTDSFAIANPMDDATVAILGAAVLSIDPAASVVCGFAVAIPMGDATKA
jgi:hypothetical protein